MCFIALFCHLVGLIEALLSLLPVLLVKADVRHTEEALKLHLHGPQLLGNPDALGEVALRLLDLSLQ